MSGTSPTIDWNGQYAETPELSVHHVRGGKGAPIVFLHGWPEFKRTWQFNLGAMAAAGYDCIAPDLRGFGKTVAKVPRPATGTTPQMLAKDLAAFADAIGVRRFAIVSHDVGAFVAQAFALAYPERVSALFFGNCPYAGVGKRWGDFQNFPETWYQQFHQKDFAAALVGSSREACRIYFGAMLRHWCHNKAAADALVEEWVDNFMLPGNLQGGFDWYVGVAAFRRRMMAGGDIRLPKITAPAYFYWGAHDPVIKLEFADKLGDYFADHTLEKAENAGHFVHFEQPEAWNRRMRAFFGKVLV